MEYSDVSIKPDYLFFIGGAYLPVVNNRQIRCLHRAIATQYALLHVAMYSPGVPVCVHTPRLRIRVCSNAMDLLHKNTRSQVSG